MGLKLLMFLCAAAAGILAGNAYNRLLAGRKRYFSEYRRFLQYVDNDLAYLRTDILTLTDSFGTTDPLLAKHLTEFREGLKSGERKLSRGVLTVAETEEVSRTLFSIGRVDADTQIKELKNARNDAEERYRAAETRHAKYGPLAVKLGLLAGLALGILTL